MKKATKIISFITISIISFLLSIFNIFITSDIVSLVRRLYKIAMNEGEIFHFSSFFVLSYILIFILIVICILTIVTVIILKPKRNKITQSILLYINISVLIASIIFLLITYLKTNDLYTYAILPYPIEEPIIIDYFFYQNIFLILILNAIANITLSVLSLKHLYKKIIDTEKDNQSNDENILIKNEIEKLKKQLELENLKNEYKDLYNQLQQKK